MSDKKNQITIPARKLAEWLDGQPGTWWNVDGDPLLTSEVVFPCPNDELVEALRKHDHDIVIFTRKPRGLAANQDANILDLDDLADIENPRKEKIILAAWKGCDNEWLLSEDKDMAEEAQRAAAGATDAKAAH
jgi:hypothetical protein